MFALGKRKKSNSLTGIVTGPEGIALARVQRDKNGQFVLDACEFTALPDQKDPGNTGLGKLIKVHGLDKQACATILPVGCYFRTGAGHTFEVHPPLEIPEGPDTDARVRLGTQRLAEVIEGIIRKAPEQWHVVVPNWPSDRVSEDEG